MNNYVAVAAASGNNSNLAKIQALEKRLMSQQEELTDLHKRKGENAQMIVDLNIKLEKQNKTMTEKDIRIAEQLSTNNSLRAELHMLTTSIQELKGLNSCLRDEHTALQLAFASLEDKLWKVQKEEADRMATISSSLEQLEISTRSSPENGIVFKGGDMNNSRLRKIFLDETTSDVQFIFDFENNVNEYKAIVPAHKCILSISSPVFETMFYGSLPEQKDVRITDATFRGFTEFIRYLYCNEVILNFELVEEVMYLAKKYDVNDLLSLCNQYLMNEISTNQLGMGLLLASKFDLYDLETYCKIQIFKKHKEFFEQDSIIAWDNDIFKTIMSYDIFKFYGEEVFGACLRRAQHTLEHENGLQNESQMKDITTKFNEYYDLIEFSSMSARKIVSILADYSNFFTPERLAPLARVLLDKYPVSLTACAELRYDLQFVDTQDVKHSIEEVGRLTFQCSKRLYFIGYRHAALCSDDWIETTVLIGMTIIKKSHDNQIEDIVYVRRMCGALSKSEIITIEHETLAIEPNVKYELRLTLFGGEPNKFYFSTVFTPNVSSSENEELVTVESHHTPSIISSLVFKH